MKKLLIALFALSSVAAMAAEGINVYGRVGLDVYSKYNKLVLEGEDVSNSKGRVGVNLALEVTKDVTPEFEAGFGIGYTARGKRDFKVTDDFWREEIYGKIPSYYSIPLYATAKYKFSTDSALKPYVKADLGYSINNLTKGSFKLNQKDLDTGNVTESDWHFTGLKVKNGLYAAVGVGAEYNNFITDLSYVFTQAKYTLNDSDNDSYRSKGNNHAVRLTVGYKFSF